MPKLKTHKSSQKRIVRLSGTGKLMMRKMSVAHRARFKSKRAKQNSTQNFVATGAIAKKLIKMAFR
ncbi:MAG: bL35 family ribosomal protein [Patescibacteria group bacterium]